MRRSRGMATRRSRRGAVHRARRDVVATHCLPFGGITAQCAGAGRTSDPSLRRPGRTESAVGHRTGWTGHRARQDGCTFPRSTAIGPPCGCAAVGSCAAAREGPAAPPRTTTSARRRVISPTSETMPRWRLTLVTGGGHHARCPEETTATVPGREPADGSAASSRPRRPAAPPGQRSGWRLPRTCPAQHGPSWSAAPGHRAPRLSPPSSAVSVARIPPHRPARHACTWHRGRRSAR